jgi:hypothetical protein
VSNPAESHFWEQVARHIGDHYRPHTPEYGVFLFREKLRRAGFRQERALRYSPALVARGVPWALLMTMDGRSFVKIDAWGSTGYGYRRFVCFDSDFELFLGSQAAGGDWDATYLLVRISAGRLAAIERGRLDVRTAIRKAEDGLATLVKVAAGHSYMVPPSELDERVLPPIGEMLADPNPAPPPPPPTS